MWPKLLFELLPHVARLVPMADKFFATRTASERAQEAALLALSGTVREDLSQVTTTHTGLRRELVSIGEEMQAVRARVAGVADDASRTRIAVQSVEARISKLERTGETAMRLIAVVLLSLAAVLVLLAVVLVKLRGR